MGLGVADVGGEEHAPIIPRQYDRAVARATLFVIPGSHPSMTARLMLERKGIDYRRVDLMPVISKAALRAARFPAVTVPALRIDGRRVQGSREISRELDRLVPEPPLFPADAEARAAVEAAERFGDEELQAPARRILWNALHRDRSPLRSFSTGARLGIPIDLAVKTAAPIVALSARFNDATDDNVRADLAALPAQLDRVDGWIADGVLGGDPPNAADLQIATSLRLLMTMDDVRPAIEGRPAGALATRAVPDYPGRVPPILPADWLTPLRQSAETTSS
jgi:glutathione S-transferase